MIISALTLLMGLPLALEGNMGTAHTSGMWLHFQMYSMRMSLALALCNPRRHAPIMKRYMQAGIMIASVKHMWLGQESLPLQCVRSHWGEKKRQFSPLRQKCHIVMMCFYVTLFILTASLSSRLPRRRVVVTVFSRTKRLSLRVNQHSPRVRTFSSVLRYSSAQCRDDFLHPYPTERLNTAMKTWLQYSQTHTWMLSAKCTVKVQYARIGQFLNSYSKTKQGAANH